jgi:hypothetical protein
MDFDPRTRTRAKTSGSISSEAAAVVVLPASTTARTTAARSRRWRGCPWTVATASAGVKVVPRFESAIRI